MITFTKQTTWADHLDRSFGEWPIVWPGDGSEARDAALRLGRQAENVDGYNAFEHIRGLAKEILGVEQEREMPEEFIVERKQPLDEGCRFLLTIILDIEYPGETA